MPKFNLLDKFRFTAMAKCRPITAEDVQKFLGELQFHPLPAYEVQVGIFEQAGWKSKLIYSVVNMTGKILFQSFYAFEAENWIKQREKENAI